MIEKKTNKEKNIVSKANIVGETNREIMDHSLSKEEIQEVSEEEIEQANVIINPDPNTLDRG